MKRFTRISLRTLLILITVFGVWLAVQVNRAHRQREAVAWVLGNGGEVWKTDTEHPAPKWLRDMIGDEYFQNVVEVHLDWLQVTDLTPLASLTKLESLYLRHTPVADLTPLANLTNLKWLNLAGTQVTDLTPLANLTHLQSLNLRNTQVANLTPLANLANLEWVYISGTSITDAQVKQLQQALPDCRITQY